MNWKTIVSNTMSKELSNELVSFFVEQPSVIIELLACIEKSDGKAADRSAWVLTHIWDKHPHLIQPHLSKIIGMLGLNISEAIQRSIIRILQNSDLPEKHHGFLVDYCFRKIIDPKQAIAVRAFSIPVLHRLTKCYPELNSEFKLCLEELIPNASSGLKNRAKKYLSKV